MTATPEIREFNTTDWMLLAGAEPFVDGHNPLVVDNFPYLDIVMTADRSGLTLLTEDSEYHIPLSDVMKEVFEAVVDCMFMADESELEYYISGFGFRTIY